jgi:hypothetical protein
VNSDVKVFQDVNHGWHIGQKSKKVDQS